MLYNNMFGQINVLKKGMDASLLRNETIANNIANADTPGYKKQTVEFESYLKNALNSNSDRVNSIDLNSISPTVVFENPEYNMRMDENNVDIDIEMTEKAKNSLRYSTIVESVNNNFDRINIVLNNMK